FLRDEGAADRLLTAEADAAEDAQDRQLPHVLREAAGQGENRVHQDRHHQRLDAPEAIGDRPPHHRHAPAGKEEREQDAAVVADVARRRGDARFRQQLGQRGHEHQRVDERVHAVEAPAAPGRPEALDLIRIERRPSRGERRGGGAGGSHAESFAVRRRNGEFYTGNAENSQLPTPKKTTPKVPRRAPWELEVGDWTLTCVRKSAGSRTAPSAPAPTCAGGTGSACSPACRCPSSDG